MVSNTNYNLCTIDTNNYRIKGTIKIALIVPVAS